MAFELYDDVTLVLILTLLAAYAVKSLIRPNALAHPLLLGRQSDVARVRNPGESACYRNYGVGHGTFLPPRPNRTVQTILDLLPDDVTSSRKLWTTDTTNAELKAKANAFGLGLVRALNLAPKESQVLLLLNNGIEWVIADLALASYSIPSLSLVHLNTLSHVLENCSPNAIITHASFLDQLLELLVEDDDDQKVAPTVVVVGDNILASVEKGKNAGVRVLRWEEVESAGAGLGIAETSIPKPTDVFTTSFYVDDSGEPHGVQLTHENITAGVTSLRSLFVQSAPLSSSSVIQSAYPISSPYGHAVLYTALYEGSSFSTFESASVFNMDPNADMSEIVRANALPSTPKATHLFIASSHLNSLTSAILSHAKASLWFPLLWRHKQAGLNAGHVTHDSLWDTGFVGILGNARQKALGWDDSSPWLKAIVSSGGPLDEETLPGVRVALSIPFTNAQFHPLSTGPIFASHPYDLQHIPSSKDKVGSKIAHVGAPGANVEVKLVGVNEEDVEGGADPQGKILVRGPTIGTPMPSTPDLEISDEDGRWVKTGLEGLVQSNGTFKILS